MRVQLRRLAHTRSGDKGDISNIVVIAYEPMFYDLLRDQLTPERVKQYFAGVIRGEVERYEVERLGVINIVAHGALGGGVSRSLCLDQYGKTLGALMLGLELDVPASLVPRLRGD
ncbi:MAG: hypothetical protein FJX66_10365 [Alphaproteobacteria bacterium]|nr:hypothetical protein [Alphaproteobacteria bacterium]